MTTDDHADTLDTAHEKVDVARELAAEYPDKARPFLDDAIALFTAAAEAASGDTDRAWATLCAGATTVERSELETGAEATALLEQGVVLLDRALALDPSLAAGYRYAADASIRIGDAMRDHDPGGAATRYDHAAELVARGREAAATTEDELPQLLDVLVLAELSRYRALEAMGVRTATAALDAAVAAADENGGTTWNAACAYAVAGKHALALTALESIVEHHGTTAAELEADGDLASLRELPRFTKLVARVRRAEERAARPPDPGDDDE